MNLSMVGIDYHKATINDREKFSFTHAATAQFMAWLHEHFPETGCVQISTCNRMELWFHGLNGDPLSALLSYLDLDYDAYRHMFTERVDEEAVNYLFELTCGMHSQIFGEDQILTQVKQALATAHECSSADPVLETLFRLAVTSGKRIKTDVNLTQKNMSIPEGAAAMLESLYGSFAGKNCLVIGNGEMGRLMTNLLIARGANVSMTLRQYKKHDAIIPKDAEVVLYDDRYEVLPQKDYIFSATTSPHYTVKAETLLPLLEPGHSYVFVDLAVPRDIDPEITSCPQVTLYDMDQIGVRAGCDDSQLDAARQIMEEYKEEFQNWYYFRQWIPTIGRTSEIVALETQAKLTKVYRNISKQIEDPEEFLGLQDSVQRATEKSVMKLLFGLRERLDREHWEVCLKALEESAGDFDI